MEFLSNDDITTWQRGTDMPGKRANGCAVQVSPSMVLIIGGVGAGRFYNTVLAYNLTSMEWTEKAPLKIPRSEHACVNLDGKIYVTGIFWFVCLFVCLFV